MKAEEFDKKFDDGDYIIDTLDISKATRSMQNHKRINIDFPIWMIESLDKAAYRMGVTRQSVIKIWLAERLETLAANNQNITKDKVTN
ncbi:MAG: CopG family transcriptional regulator [Desulfamplus sp.]|nr:CopG family transcriptional regulator [Desulfamplus sp.]